ncbi:vacuolar protein 14 C-terminal Fig4p binding-domain-containing protein [Podospora fimiseda]|uniref:Vacuolar protein 14 C-terminal Fig4p binding-domain-containing protein n=1 Tax=Podospora fimiseda TaxID=252190 RepID=A0AAN7BR50_9PEZI|nr:vacuolar protein 14 C-terminal Fig4p binding-domain-containing protein [Podospora fimiseda]
MDAAVQRALNDKLYDKRKVGALDTIQINISSLLIRYFLSSQNRLERIIRELVAAKEDAHVEAILDQLVNDYAYAVHQPHARNGGLIGLAAAAIALGSELARHLEIIVPPVLACFADQDARVRYYACEAMYNIAKVAKGEILTYFNHIFDALCKLGADTELSVKNGAELLDRLIKDIVSESAATYVSVLEQPPPYQEDDDKGVPDDSLELPTAFSLKKFIPLLRDRIDVLNPFTRTFLVGWIILLDSIPDLELVTYLPEFLGGLLRFLSDPNRDVHVATQGCLDKFLNEIRRIARIKKGIAESKKSKEEKRKREDSADSNSLRPQQLEEGDEVTSDTAADDEELESEDDWVPGQDVQINYKAILEILTATLDSPLGRRPLASSGNVRNANQGSEEDGLLESLRWIVEFLDICPEEVLPFTPKILANLLPAMASGVEPIRQAAARVNTSLMDYVVSLSDDAELATMQPPPRPQLENTRQDGTTSARVSLSSSRELEMRSPTPAQGGAGGRAFAGTPTPATSATQLQPQADLDYAAAVNSLTLLFLNDHEATRVAALTWLIMLHRKAPRKVLAFNDGTFPALLKTLSDPAEAVVTKDLQLLSQISRNSEAEYFTNFMVNLLQLFSTDRKLLETRGNLIIRQLCTSLSPEQIYRTLADCIEKEEDLEFASIMVQNLNNNLITAPELAELRKRLRNLETKEGQTFFITLFRSWCYNAVATFSLCLLAQAYEQAYNLLQIFAELEMTVNILIQIDKLVQLLESPVFTYLRLQLLEPEKYPHLYKCLYGLLMLLPQSSAFAALKNRLNSVSSIGYLHIAPRPNVTTPSVPSFDRPNRLKGREEGIIRWGDLLEKFKSVQERSRRLQRGDVDDGSFGMGDLRMGGTDGTMEPNNNKPLPKEPGPGAVGGGVGVGGGAGVAEGSSSRGPSRLSKEMPANMAGGGSGGNVPPTASKPETKHRTGLGRQLGRFSVAGRGKRNP